MHSQNILDLLTVFHSVAMDLFASAAVLHKLDVRFKKQDQIIRINGVYRIGQSYVLLARLFIEKF